jgi:lipase chaperone LimK
VKRKPRGYVGVGHETIGSDILAVDGAIKALAQSETTVKRILGDEQRAFLASVKASEWYPIEKLLTLMDAVEKHLGRFGLIKMGRTLFKLSHEARVAELAKSARDIIYKFDDFYHYANRGKDIGGWQVVSFTSQRAELEKTTPHHCAMEEGILAQALQAVGAPSVVSQSRCFREGADACLFVISPAGRGRWDG